MSAQLGIIQKQQVLTAAQIQLTDGKVGNKQTRNTLNVKGEEAEKQCLGAEGVVSELQDARNTVSGFVPIDPSVHNFSLPTMSSSSPVPPDGVYFEHNRGHCYVCGIELTSLQHKTQHVEGKQHKKKVLTFCNGGGMNETGAGVMSGSQGVMMCAICNVPLSGEQNVQQHFSSTKHKARKAEFYRQSVSLGHAADVRDISQPPTSASTNTFSTLHGPLSLPKPQVSGQMLQPTAQQRPHQVSSSMQADHPVDTNVHRQPMEWRPSGGVCHMCDQRFQSGEEFIKHLRSAEHQQRENDMKRPGCQVCQVKYSDHDSARQHLNSQEHKESVMCSWQTAEPDLMSNLRTDTNLPNITQSSIPSDLSHKMSDVSGFEQTLKKMVIDDSSVAVQTKIPRGVVQPFPLMTRSGSDLNVWDQDTKTAPLKLEISEQNPEMRDVPEYIFDGCRGHCNVCKIELTSKSHAESHLAGAKHKKASLRWQSTVSFQASGASALPQAYGVGQGGVPLLPAVNCEKPIFSSQSDLPLGKQGYRFDGNRGYCFACKIELTSEAHANQHLVGKKHQTATERWIQEGQSCNYPLYCDICLKPFTGQESAAQHFLSEKHKKKQLLSEGAASAKKDPDSGALMIVRDGQMWYMCETCKCPLNTLEQFRLHVNSPRHNAEVEKAKKQDHSNRSSPTDAGDVAQNNLSATRNSPDPSDLQHLVTRSSVKTTPGLQLAQPQQTPLGNAGLINTEPVQKELGTQASASGHVLHGLNYNIRPETNNSSVWQSDKGGILKVENGSLQAFMQREIPSQYVFRGIPSQHQALHSNSFSQVQHGPASSHSSSSLGQRGQRFDEGTFSDLNIRQISCGNTGSRGTRSTGQVLRIDADYEPDEENMKSLPVSASTSDYQEPNAENNLTEDTDQSLAMSSIHGGYTLSMTDQEKQQASYAAGTMPDRFTSIYTDPGSLSATGAFQANPEGIVIQQRRSTPELNQFKGFRYACFLCKQPMNTKEDYDRHMKGLKHQMKAATVSAPDKSREKLIKVHRVSSDKEAHCCRTKPRKYQVELMKKAMAHDSTVVYLPTGTGKTLTAMMTLSCMLTLNPTRPVLFLVDKVLLVLQQARYIINELGNRDFLRPHLTEDSRLEKRNLKVAVLCGGLSVRDGTPLWKHDVIVTTAAFCQNLLQDEVLRWANFSLVVFDEAHHCTKNHPYNKLLVEHHNPLPVQQRPKVLGLTASPAGRRTEEETLTMLKNLLDNLGGATIAIIEDREAKEQLDMFSSSARLVPICVPMTEAEMGFHERLLSYFIQAYVELMRCSNLQQISGVRLQGLMNSKPINVQDITTFAQHLMSEPDELSEMVQLAQTARMKSSITNQNWFENIRMHVMTVGMTLLNSEDGIDFVLDDLERLFNRNLNKCFDELKDMGLPCKQIASYVSSLCDAARLRAIEESEKSEVGSGVNPSTMSIFQELLGTLANPHYVNWDSQDSMVLVLVRERKVAHKFKDHLKRTSFVRERNMRVAVVVGHGAGSGEGEGMNLRKQDKVLQGIKCHRYDIVVATSVAEEGVDIPECQLVVCLNPPTTVKALVQMRGRARQKDSYFVVLCSSQQEKQKLEELQKQELNMKRAAARLTQEHSAAR
ncbi:uncharacterized protein LOC143286826 isoform X2 [Babylonia areolata]